MNVVSMQVLILLLEIFPSNVDFILLQNFDNFFLKLFFLRFNANATHVRQRIDLESFLPDAGQYFYRYGGSLTTPDCNEVVEWTVVKDPIYVKPSLIQKFRNVRRSDKRRIGENHRPTQERGKRTIKYMAKQWN